MDWNGLWNRCTAGVLLVGAAALLVACPAVYPELKTPVRSTPTGQALEPAPPNDVRWISFRGAKIPPLTRDGRRWGNDLSKGLPDPYARLLLNGTELFRTSVERGTLNPVWRDSPKGNFRIRGDQRLRVELWDARVINDLPIGIKDLGSLETHDQRALEEVQEECSSGATFIMAVEPAHGFQGYGLFYELRTYDVFLTRLYEESPAARAGLRAGDQLLSINDRPVRQMNEGDVQSAFNAPTISGISLSVRHEDGSVVNVRLKEGAVYPLFREIGSIE